MRKRYVIAVAAAATVGALVVVISERRRQEQAVRRLEEQMASLTAARDEDRVAVTRLAPVAAALQGYVHAAPTPAAEEPSQADDGVAENLTSTTQKPTSLSTAEVHKRYESAFATDPPDPEWAERAKRIAQEKLPSVLPEGSFVRSFECRSSICRLETSHAGRSGSVKFLQAALLDPAGHLWNAATYSAPLNDDPEDGLMVTYIAREGRSFPDVTN